MNNRAVKKRLKITRDFVAGLAREYHRARLEFLKIQKEEDLIRYTHARDYQLRRKEIYESSKAVLLSCSVVLEGTMLTLDTYRTGCDNLVKRTKWDI